MKRITLDAERPCLLALDSMMNLAVGIFIADDFHNGSRAGFAGKPEEKHVRQAPQSSWPVPR